MARVCVCASAIAMLLGILSCLLALRSPSVEAGMPPVLAAATVLAHLHRITEQYEAVSQDVAALKLQLQVWWARVLPLRQLAPPFLFPDLIMDIVCLAGGAANGRV